MLELLGLILVFFAIGFTVEVLVILFVIWWMGPSDWDDPYEDD